MKTQTKPNIKITENDIFGAKTDIFGDWINNVKKDTKNFKKQFNNEPFPHIVIHDFLKKKVAEKIFDLFPDIDENWYEYMNPIEVKYAYDNIKELPKEIQNVFYALSTTEIINIIHEATDIDNLEADPYLHGAGLHAHPRNGRLGVHLDYEKHMYTGKERRLNIILYLSKDWKEEWNGHTELWDENVTKPIIKSPIIFNTAIIFKTNDISWHGVSDRILCPKGVFRKSLAYYYVAEFPQKNGRKPRLKASFRKKPDDLCEDHPDKMEKLYKIRPNRRISEEDMQEIWPDWNMEIN